MADSEVVIFVALTAVWFVGRIVLRSYVRRRLQEGTMTQGTALFALIASFAVLPLLAIPWRRSPTEIAFLVFTACAIFLIAVVAARFAGSSSRGA